jgi:biopolymer transport protein ExbD
MRRLRPRRAPAPSTVAALAPLVDVVTMLLLVLLRAWSADPPLDLPPGELTLPLAVGTDEAPHLTRVALGAEGIHLDGIRIAATTWYLQHPDELITELRTPLLQRGVDRVALYPDADLPYALVRKALLALREAGVREVVVITVDRGSL